MFGNLPTFITILVTLLTPTISGFRLPKFRRPQPMLSMLDAMQELMTGGGVYDRKLYEQFRSCMKSFDQRLPGTQDSAWQGIIDYWNMGGAPDDLWGKAPTGLRERNITKISVDSMEIYEPCNFASNLVYYHLLNEMCIYQSNGGRFKLPFEFVQAIASTITVLPMGSCFFHGSNTKLGMQQDFHAIKVVLYLIHQASLAGLQGKSSITTDFRSSPRTYTSVELANQLQRMYASEPVRNWYSITKAMDIPDFRQSVYGIFLTILTLKQDPALVDIISQIVPRLLSLDSASINFMREQYLPEINRLTNKYKANVKQSLRSNSLSAMLKLVHAAVWRERDFFNTTLITSTKSNFVSYFLNVNPHLHRQFNSLTDNTYFGEVYHSLSKAYPGEENCRRRYPHPKWHVLSSSFLLDIIYLADDLYVLFTS